MKVLFLRTADSLHFSYRYLVEFIDHRYPIEIYDPNKPAADQFNEIEVVIDTGGAIGTHEMVDAAKAAGVKLWQVTTNGLDHVDTEYILGKGLLLTHSPGSLTAVPLAEHALLMILYFAKNLNHNHTKDWHRVMNDELEGKTLGLIGFGASAKELARRARALGLRIIAIDNRDIPQQELDEFHLAFLGYPEDLEKILVESDFLSVHVPLTNQTRHLIDQHAFSLMKEKAVLINVARGEIVDNNALIGALTSGLIKGAGIDAYAEEPLAPEHPLLKLGNVLTTPHVAGFTQGTWHRRAKAAAENIDRLAKGLSPRNLVDPLSSP